MQPMTSLERTMAVIRHQIPDRVPVDLHNFLVTIAYAGYPMAQALQNGEMLAEAQLKFWRDFRHDVLLVENGVVAEAGACGCQIDWPADGPPRVTGHVLADGLEKVTELKVPDPWKTPPMRENLEAVRILRRELGDQVYIMGRCDQAPASLAGALRGYEQFILDMADNEQPELIHQVLDFCAQVQIRYMLAMKEAGAHGTAMGEMGVDIIGPRLYRTFAHPYDRRVVATVAAAAAWHGDATPTDSISGSGGIPTPPQGAWHGDATPTGVISGSGGIPTPPAPDFPVALHICGNATLILPEMLDTGAQILELDYKTDKVKAKELLRGRAAFLGPVNPELIWGGTPAQVEDAAREAIQVLGPGGGLILGPGCALGHTTPPDNIHALIEAAWKYGVYNPDGTLRAA